jgi:hypothetical protein
MPKPYGASIAITGGAEVTPIIEVSTFIAQGSMHDGDVTLSITQDDKTIQLSPETIQAIIAWYYDR